MRFLSCLFAVLSLSAVANAGIKNVVVLMMENRAFDHVLGHLDNADGCVQNPRCSNPIDPLAPNSPRVAVTFDAPPASDLAPGHSIQSTETQLWGSLNQVYPALMSGFVKSMNRTAIMRCFNATSLPIISTLAKEYTLFDAFFSSVPGPTGPNRLYLLTGTSHGTAFNEKKPEGVGFPQKTFFGDVLDSGFGWKVYYGDFPTALELRRLRLHPTRFHHMKTFYKHAKEGKLDPFIYIEPRWGDDFGSMSDNQHPIHSMYYGEVLIKNVYEALRASPQWNETALILTYDEHGGFFDHRVPPFSGTTPNPDGLNSTDADHLFNFTRLGIRVPFIVVSPWVSKGKVVSDPPQHAYEHTSVMKTIRGWLNMKVQRPLTKREAWAASFEHVQNGVMRADTPKTLPEAYRGNTPSLREETAALKNKLSDLQVEVVQIARNLMEDHELTDEKIEEMTRLEGSRYLRKQLRRWRQKHQ